MRLFAGGDRVECADAIAAAALLALLALAASYGPARESPMKTRR